MTNRNENPSRASVISSSLRCLLTSLLNESKSSAVLRETGSAVIFPDDFTWGKTTDRMLFQVKKECWSLIMEMSFPWTIWYILFRLVCLTPLTDWDPVQQLKLFYANVRPMG